MATKAARKSKHEETSEPDGLLASAARTVGHAAGTAVKVIGLAPGVAAVPAKSKRGGTKTLKTQSARVRRKNHAEEIKSAATSLFRKGSADLGAPYRRVMGKPTANWTEKEIEYISGLVVKHGK